jgi:FkbH-like protein
MTAEQTGSDERAITRQQIKEAAERQDGVALVSAVRRLIEGAPRPADVAFAAGRLAALGPDRAKQAGLVPVRAYCARSVTIEPLVPYLLVHGASSGLWLQLEIGGYGSFADELLNPRAALAQARPDLVLFLADVEDVAGDLRDACAAGSAEQIGAALEEATQSLTSLVAGLRRHSRARLVVQGLIVPDRPVLGEVADANLAAGELWALRRLNEALGKACREATDAVLFDQDQVAARCGRARYRDERLFRSTRLAVAVECFDAYSAALVRAIRPLFLPSRKVLVTDLDNTFWGGIVGEDGPDRIASGTDFPGNCYREYQRLLQQLSRRGVLLAIASKNNEPDVREAFERRRRDLLLSLDGFASVQIGWQSKVLMLKSIAKELSLGVDSFVFVDDSPMECAEVRQGLPEVQVIQIPPAEPWRIAPLVAAQLGAFDQLAITEDDRQRVEEYRSQRQRAQLEAEAGSRDEFLGSLGIVCTMLSALEAPLERTAQLLSKTNQFNLTTRRHSAGDVERLAAEPNAQAWALRVRDRFGDAGVVGVALCRMQGTLCVIDSFLLSCRVIGRGVESALLHHLAKRAIVAGATHLIGEYTPTKKNPPCAEFYPGHHFRPLDPTRGPIGQASGTLYELDLAGGPPPLPAWITLEENG